MLVGCYNPKRDLSIDPHNTPIIHILDAIYDAPTGMAVVQWEYPGRSGLRTSFSSAGRRPFSAMSRVPSRVPKANTRLWGAFRDGGVIAGEAMQYRVVAEYSAGGLARTDVVKVPIPGAGLREIRRDPVALAVQVVWQAGDGITHYEVVRTPTGGDSETIFIAQDPQQTSFWDRSVADNRPYHYAIRSHLSTGVQLMSRSVRVQFYREGGRHLVEPLHGDGERMRLAATDLDGEADMLALIGRADRISPVPPSAYPQYRPVAIVSRGLVGISFVQLDDLVPLSLDLVGLPLSGTRSVFPRVYVGGLASDGRVMVVGIDLSNNTTVWHIPDRWMSRSSHARLARDEQQRIYVATDGATARLSAAGDRLGAFDFKPGRPRGYRGSKWRDLGRVGQSGSARGLALFR